MPPKYVIDPARIATVLTSCGRFDLLEETVSSFLTFFDASSIVIAEDSEDVAGAATFAQKFPMADVRVNEPKLGQLRSIDKAYTRRCRHPTSCIWKTIGVSPELSTSTA